MVGQPSGKQIAILYLWKIVHNIPRCLCRAFLQHTCADIQENDPGHLPEDYAERPRPAIGKSINASADVLQKLSDMNRAMKDLASETSGDGVSSALKHFKIFAAWGGALTLLMLDSLCNQ